MTEEELAALPIDDLLTLRDAVQVAMSALSRLPEVRTVGVSVHDDGADIVIALPRHALTPNHLTERNPFHVEP